MCEPVKRDGMPVGAILAVAACAVGVYAVAQLVVPLAVMAAAAAVAVAGLAYVSRRYAARLSVITWPVRSHYGERVMARAALPAPLKAIEAPKAFPQVRGVALTGGFQNSDRK